MRVVDELRSGLELATDDELRAMTEILFRPRFNPLDYLYTPDPTAVQSRDRNQWLDQLDKRVRYLAADGFTVLRGQAQVLPYRQILLQICRQLKVKYLDSWSTDDLESELFLALLDKTWNRMSKQEQAALQKQVRTALVSMEPFRQLSPQLQKHPLDLVLKGSSALAMGAVVRPLLLKQITKQFAVQMARYQLAQQGMRGAASMVQRRAAQQVAARGMALNAARYGAVRGIFTVLGPAMWAWFFADLGWRAIATNYTRVIPVVFTLAQIRLTRGDGLTWETA
ncbi:MAG: hypothetical protein AAFU71_05940 [Cyanobacteria bacterium J06632_22]